MKRPTRRTLLCVCAAVAGGGVGAAGCGGGGEQEAPAAAVAAPGEVEIVDFAYDPETVEIEAGNELAWANADKAPHTATADDGSFDTGTLKRGDEAVVALDEPGTYAYYCRFHPFMKATVEVR